MLNKYTELFTEKKYDRTSELIVYGASVYGEIAFYTLQTLGIMPDFFCDRALDKDFYFGIKVIRPDELVFHGNAMIIIASSDYFHEIRKQLSEAGYKKLYNMNYLLNIQIDKGLLSARAADFYDKREAYIDIANAEDDEEDLNFPRVQFVVTSACSLKCRNCTSLMQYYEKPENSDLQYYKAGFDRLLDCVSNIFDLRIIGGEPFINGDMYKIIEWYHDSDKIKIISVYTNGTIIPSERCIDQLRRKKVRVHISDYGFNRDKIIKLKTVFEQNDVRYYVQPYDYWQDSGNLLKRNYTEEKKKYLFERCYERECFSFFNGRLYHCPRAAHGIKIGAIPDIKSEYVDLMDSGIDDNEILNQLKFQRDRSYIDACDYCNGADRRGIKIEPAIQTDHFLKFSE